MKIIVLGSGTGIPAVERNAPGYFLQTKSGLACLVDCGSGVLRQLVRVGMAPGDLDVVCITHTHPDHVTDLTALIHALRLPGLNRCKPLLLFGPPGFRDFFQHIVLPVSGAPKGFTLEIQEATPRHTVADLTIQTAPTRHADRLASCAYRLTADGKSVVFSGDCDQDPALVILARNADLLVLDCSTLAAGKFKGHLSAMECGQVAAEAAVRELLLTHFYPISGPEEQRLDEARKGYSGPVRLAEDFLEISLS
ncbi:MAG: MBL fold metallo-hydrolase [Magnetococcus sp. DMHC-1]|nr:MBL fold metallo-hydrolase [Magnetococcales bacterium]